MKASYTLAELADAVGGTARGSLATAITGVEDLRRAQSCHATWISSDAYARHLPSSGAGVVLVSRDFGPTPMAAILCDRIDAASARLLQLFTPPWPKPVGVHMTAVVDPTARLGTGCLVGSHAYIGPGVRIGANTVIQAGVHVHEQAEVGENAYLWDHVVVRERCRVGNRVTLHPGVVIGSDGFGYYFAAGAHQKIAHGGIVTIEDDVEIGANSTIDRAKFGETRIGRGSKIDNLVQVGHNAVIGPHCILVAGVLIAGSVRLGAGVVVGGNSGVREGVEVGDGVRLASDSTIWADTAPGAVVSGVPARDHRDELKTQALVRRLPELRRQLRELAERIEKLEAPADHRPCH